MTKTVLITGASGMMGLKLCQVLQDKGLQIESERFDISSPVAVQQISQKFKKLNCIIHCAAMTNVNQCEMEKEKCSVINVVGTQNIVTLAKQFDADLIYISTPMVFPGDQGDYKETDQPQSLNYYAQTKLQGEEAVLAYNKGLVLRVNPIGVRPPGAHPNFIQWFVNAAKQNQSVTLFSDVKINPISTTTLAEIIYKLIQDFQPGILHLGSTDIVNKAEIWDLVLKHFPKFSGTVTRNSVDEAAEGKIAKRPKEMWLNVDQAQARGLGVLSWRKEVAIVLEELGIRP